MTLLLASMLALSAAPAAAPGQSVVSVPVTVIAAEEVVDEERLRLAKVTVDAVWPLGTYARMMNGSMEQIMDSVMAGMFDMRASDLVAAAPVDGQSKAVAKEVIGQQTMRELMLKSDPHFEERFRIMNRTMWAELTPVMASMEPGVREGLARAFARKFSAAQLADLNRFFATPSGRVYAAESMIIYMDPEVVGALTKLTPEMMKAMPAIMKKVEAATAHLPPPPKPEEQQEATEEEVVS